MSYAEEDDGPGWEQQQDNEARHWWEDEQAMAEHKRLREEFNRECVEFDVEQRAWEQRLLQERIEQQKLFDREFDEWSARIRRLGATMWR